MTFYRTLFCAALVALLACKSSAKPEEAREKAVAAVPGEAVPAAETAPAAEPAGEAPAAEPAGEAPAETADAPAKAADEKTAAHAGPASVEIRNAIQFGNFTLGGQPTAEELAAAKEKGYTTIINLRTPGEPGVAGEEKAVTALGMTYVSIPVAGKAGLTSENAAKLAAAMTAASGKAIIHCASGNRVGALLAIKAAKVDGEPAAKAYEIGKKTGLTSLDPAVKEALSLEEDPGPGL